MIIGASLNFNTCLVGTQQSTTKGLLLSGIWSSVSWKNVILVRWMLLWGTDMRTVKILICALHTLRMRRPWKAKKTLLLTNKIPLEMKRFWIQCLEMLVLNFAQNTKNKCFNAFKMNGKGVLLESIWLKNFGLIWKS